MPDHFAVHVPCVWERPGNKHKTHCIVAPLVGDFKGADVILQLEDQDKFKYADKRTVIMAKNRFTDRYHDGNLHADASPAIIQIEERHKHYALAKEYRDGVQSPEQKKIDLFNEEQHSNTKEKKDLVIHEIVLVDDEMIEAFEAYQERFGTKKETAKRLIEHAMRLDALKLT
jgi:hypothetical protein